MMPPDPNTSVSMIPAELWPRITTFVRLRSGPIFRSKEARGDLVRRVAADAAASLSGSDLQIPGDQARLLAAIQRLLTDRRHHYLQDRKDAAANARPLSEEVLALYPLAAGSDARGEDFPDSVEKAFDGLVPDYRQALLYHHVLGLDASTIAQVLGRTEDGTRTMLARAQSAFEKLLTPKAEGPE